MAVIQQQISFFSRDSPSLLFWDMPSHSRTLARTHNTDDMLMNTQDSLEDVSADIFRNNRMIHQTARGRL